MSMGLSGFKKISSTPHVTVLRHPSGHEISIAHMGLGEDLKKKLQEMPVHLADGTPGDAGAPAPIEADPVPVGGSSAMPEQTPEAIAEDAKLSPPTAPQAHPTLIASLANQFGRQFALPERTALALASKAYQAVAPHLEEVAQGFGSGLAGQDAPLPEQASAPAPQKAGKSGPTPADYRMPGLSDSGQQAQPPAQPAYQSPYDQEAQAAKEMGAGAQKLQELHQGNIDALNDMSAEAVKHFMDNPIDAKQYMTTMDDPHKVSTALGLILGGLGTGANGKNMAVEALNSQIDRNMQAQLANLGQKKSLISALHEQLGNMKDAMDMGRAINMDKYTAQMAQAAANIQDPMQKQRMMMAMQDFQQRSQGLKSGVAQRQAGQQGAKQGGIPPEMLIKYMIPPNEQEPYFKELATAQSMSKQRDDLMNLFDELSHMNTLGNTLKHPIDTYAANQRSMATIAQLAHDSEGRVTDADVGYLRGLLPERGTSQQETAKRRQAAFNYINQKMNFPRLASINPNLQFGSTQAPPVSNPNVAKSYGQNR